MSDTNLGWDKPLSSVNVVKGNITNNVNIYLDKASLMYDGDVDRDFLLGYAPRVLMLMLMLMLCGRRTRQPQALFKANRRLPH